MISKDSNVDLVSFSFLRKPLASHVLIPRAVFARLVYPLLMDVSLSVAAAPMRQRSRLAQSAEVRETLQSSTTARFSAGRIIKPSRYFSPASHYMGAVCI